MEITTGMPNPPLRMMAPNGAPIKKSTRQAMESVNLRCHSISYRIMESSSLLRSTATDSTYAFALRAMFEAASITLSFSGLVNLEK